MTTISIAPNGDCAALHQGSNLPLVVTLDLDATELTALSVSLWPGDKPAERPLKAWTMDDVAIDDATVACPLTAEETAAFPQGVQLLEVKGLDANGYTVFWEKYRVKVVARNDRDIPLA